MTIWDNVYVLSAAYFVLAVVAIVVFLAVFELVTKYNDWEEIKNGNLSVALATGGKILAIGIILAFSINSNESLWEIFIWGTYGSLLQLVVYYLFEFFTPKFKVDEETANDNRAVGLISFIVSISLALVIGVSIA